jgi:transcriptional/translational regulatory protein YebC/TACO1
LRRVPQTPVQLEGKQAASRLRMIEAIEEQDDVQNVFANFDIDDDELEKLSA